MPSAASFSDRKLAGNKWLTKSRVKFGDGLYNDSGGFGEQVMRN